MKYFLAFMALTLLISCEVYTVENNWGSDVKVNGIELKNGDCLEVEKVPFVGSVDVTGEDGEVLGTLGSAGDYVLGELDTDAGIVDRWLGDYEPTLEAVPSEVPCSPSGEVEVEEVEEVEVEDSSSE